MREGRRLGRPRLTVVPGALQALAGLIELRAHSWVATDQASVVRVEVLKPPAVCHTVPLATIQKALNRRPRTSEEMIRRNRPRGLWDELQRGYPLRGER